MPKEGDELVIVWSLVSNAPTTLISLYSSICAYQQVCRPDATLRGGGQLWSACRWKQKHWSGWNGYAEQAW